MRPLILRGHTRPITQVKYNREGDLIFSSAKDSSPCVWFSSNGERLGTYDGHNGAVWCIDVDWRTEHLISGGGDTTLRRWDCETGTQLCRLDRDSPVRTSVFSFSGNVVAYSTDAVMGKPCEIFLTDVRDSEQIASQILIDGPKITALLWGTLDQTLITGHENGKLTQWDLRTNKIRTEAQEHSDNINDMQTCKGGTMLITASSDKTAKVFDVDTLSCLKSYKSDTLVNSASISPTLKQVCLGGGQEAATVATTATSAGKFEAHFYDLVSENEFARVKGHFGPIKYLAFHPEASQYTSGGQDGLLRVHNLDDSYFEHVGTEECYISENI